MSIFRTFDIKKILFKDNEVYLQESTDAVDIAINENVKDSIRVGIPNKGGITYHYWKDIVKIMNAYEGTKE